MVACLYMLSGMTKLVTLQSMDTFTPLHSATDSTRHDNPYLLIGSTPITDPYVRYSTLLLAPTLYGPSQRKPSFEELL